MKPCTQRQSIYRRAANCRGSILLLTLWALALLAVFALILAQSARQKMALSYRLDERSSLRPVAEAGVTKAVSMIREMKEQGEVYSLSGSVLYGRDLRDVSVGPGKFSVYHYYSDSASSEKVKAYGFIDEERKINVNKAKREVIERLFRSLDIPEIQAQNLAAAIVDWRDEDELVSVPFGSAEDTFYRSLPEPYEAKDSEFEIPEEILLVKDVEPNIFEKIRSYVTIYGSGKVNVNTAGREVFLALGLAPEITEKILAYRRGEDGIGGTGDDNLFPSADSVALLLGANAGLSDSELSRLLAVADMDLTAEAEHFTITSYGVLPGRKMNMKVTCVSDAEGNILYWREKYGAE